MSSIPAVPPRPIYLDYHATTPVDPRVAEVVGRALLETFGNPRSADHAFGEEASAVVETARGEVAGLVAAAVDGVHFTAGSTEAIRRAIAHAVSTRGRRRRLVVVASSAEHRAVLAALSEAAESDSVEIRWLGVDSKARLDLSEMRSKARGADLVCAMAANNEVGTTHPVAEIGCIAREAGAWLMVDATQAVGRLSVNAEAWGATYLTVSAHKLYGPKGVGALITSSEIRLDEQLGTPNVPGIAGFGEACRLRVQERECDERRIGLLRDRLEELLKAAIPTLVVNGDRASRLAGNLHVSVPRVPNDAIVGRLRNFVAISTGAACTSGTPEPSHVLRAMGLPEELQEGALRIGLGKFTTEAEIDQAAEYLAYAVEATQAALGMRIHL
jgi:cysteine desulfurase